MSRIIALATTLPNHPYAVPAKVVTGFIVMILGIIGQVGVMQAAEYEMHRHWPAFEYSGLLQLGTLVVIVMGAATVASAYADAHPRICREE